MPHLAHRSEDLSDDFCVALEATGHGECYLNSNPNGGGTRLLAWGLFRRHRFSRLGRVYHNGRHSAIVAPYLLRYLREMDTLCPSLFENCIKK